MKQEATEVPHTRHRLNPRPSGRRARQDALVLNGLLETEEYAREVIRVGLMQFAPLSEVDRRVEVRTTRQTVLEQRDPEPLRLWTIIDEGALRRRVGDRGVMHRQYNHLLALSERPNVMLQVLPFAAGAHPSPTGSFVYMDFVERHVPDVVYLDGLTSALYIEDDSQVHTYSLGFNQLAMSALGVDESLEMISKLAKDGE